jgi:hypothetical protein
MAKVTYLRMVLMACREFRHYPHSQEMMELAMANVDEIVWC